MKAVVLSSIVISMLFISCGSSSSGTTYQDPHSRAHSEMHNELYQEEIQKELQKQISNFIGEYLGTIPCADCDGIKIQLVLVEDFTFTSTVNYLGKTEELETSAGTFSLKADGIVVLDKAVAGMTFFQKKSTELIILDQNAKEIISMMHKAYVLKKLP